MKFHGRNVFFKLCFVVFIFLASALIFSGIAYSQKEHGTHSSVSPPSDTSQIEISGTKSFTVEEMSKLKPEELCLVHKCTHGVCRIILASEAAKLGKCPHCGEDLSELIKIAQETEKARLEGRAPLSLSAEKQQYLGVKLGKVEQRKLSKEVYTVGRIAYDPELYVAQQEFKQALESLKKIEQSPIEEPKELARSNIKAIKLRLRILGLSEEQINEMEAHPHEDTSLILPGSEEGVWVYAPVYEYELGYLKIGQEIIVKVPAFPGKVFKGSIRAIDPVIDPLTRTARVRAYLENPDKLLRPEMYANTTIKIDVGEGLSVPRDAIFNTGKEKIVFVSLGEGRYEPRLVETGLEGIDFAEIKSGLSEGEEVVTSGNFLIDSESRLKASLGAMPGHAGMGSKEPQKSES